tara:strand:- start:343 stop:876 length:534 start_codon:yes stop_codon:yes gene_type:complete
MNFAQLAQLQNMQLAAPNNMFNELNSSPDVSSQQSYVRRGGPQIGADAMSSGLNPNGTPNERSPKWMEKIAIQKALEKTPYSARTPIFESGATRANMQGVAPRSPWENFENLQPYNGGAPNPGRSPQWVEDMAKQKMIEDQSNRIRSNPFAAPTPKEVDRYQSNHPLNQFMHMLLSK